MFKVLLIASFFMVANAFAGQVTKPNTVTGVTVEVDHVRIYLTEEVDVPIVSECSIKDQLVVLNTNPARPELYAAMLVAKSTSETIVFEVDSCAVTSSGQNTPELVGVTLGE